MCVCAPYIGLNPFLHKPHVFGVLGLGCRAYLRNGRRAPERVAFQLWLGSIRLGSTEGYPLNSYDLNPYEKLFKKKAIIVIPGRRIAIIFIIIVSMVIMLNNA